MSCLVDSAPDVKTANIVEDGAGASINEKGAVADTRTSTDDQDSSSVSDDESESQCSGVDDDLPFEADDINGDGRIVKTARDCPRQSWKRPEPGWIVAITVHQFRELREDCASASPLDSEQPLPAQTQHANAAEPGLSLEFELGEDENSPFPQDIVDRAAEKGFKIVGLLHCGIETMSKGERATFVVTPDPAASEDKASTTQPCRMEYVISLDAWTEDVDLSDAKDRSLVKRILRDGDGVTEPEDIGMVTVRCRVTKSLGDKAGEKTLVFDNMQSQDDAEDESAELEAPIDFVVDDCPFGSGVSAIVKSMSKGEQCEAWLTPEYGPESSDPGPFLHHVVVELVEAEELPPAWAANETRLEMAERFKAAGNDQFVAGDYERALRRYEKAMRYATGVPPGDYSDDDGYASTSSDMRPPADGENPPKAKGSPASGKEDVFVNVKAAVLCNQAACHLKLGDGVAALDAADRASDLRIPSDSAAGIKATYRRACALEALGDWEEARHAFRGVLKVDPKNTQCRQGIARITRAEKAYEARLRHTFGGCLASGKLSGFASDGREEEARTARDNDDAALDHFGGPGSPSQDGPWSDASESESLSGDDEDDSSNDNCDDEDEADDDSGPAKVSKPLPSPDARTPSDVDGNDSMNDTWKAGSAGAAPETQAVHGRGHTAPASEPIST